MDARLNRELVTDREHELQVGDYLVRPPGIRGSRPPSDGPAPGNRSARARPRKYCGRPRSMVAALSSLVSAAATSWPARTWKKPARACAVASAGVRSDRAWEERLPPPPARAPPPAGAPGPAVFPASPRPPAPPLPPPRRRFAGIV